MRGGRFLIRPHGLDDDVVRAFQGERGKFREDRGLRTRISSSAGIPRPSRDVRRVLAWVISSVPVDFPFISLSFQEFPNSHFPMIRVHLAPVDSGDDAGLDTSQ